LYLISYYSFFKQVWYLLFIIVISFLTPVSNVFFYYNFQKYFFIFFCAFYCLRLPAEVEKKIFFSQLSYSFIAVYFLV